MMKRSSRTLVSYSSSESETEEPPAKKKKLPSLAASLVTPVPVDHPELHQGRVRTIPHVEGQWAAHVYVSLEVKEHRPLGKLLDDIFQDAAMTTPTLKTVWSTTSNKRELHISLSRPTYLRAHQREDLKRAVQTISKRFSPFSVSFATFSELINDERTRTFLTIEVGAGHHELQAISLALTPTLHAILQKEYYEDPRFHASIAWALLCPPKATTDGSGLPSTDGTTGPSHYTSQPSQSIPHLPKNLIPLLIKRHGAALSSARMGAFDIEAITLKIGKDVHSWRFVGH